MTTMPASPVTGFTPRTSRWRPASLTGVGFVAAVLLGNSLTESVSGSETLGDLAAIDNSLAARSGLALELLGFVLLIGFVAAATARCRRGTATTLAVVAGAVTVAVKVSSAAIVLGALHERERIDESTATVLVAVNSAAFVLFWIGFGLFVAALAVAIEGPGRGWRWSGALLGGLSVAAGVLGSVVPTTAVPVPFLLCLVWSGALSVRLAVGEARRSGPADSVGSRLA